MSTRPSRTRVVATLGSLATVALAVYAFAAPFARTN